jgi:hypothetical protein
MEEKKSEAAQDKLAQARQQRQPEASDRTERELELARLQNENLKLQIEMLERQEKIADAQLKAIEAAKPRDVLAEAQAKEDAIVNRLKAEREECRRQLEEGLRKFWVHMAHQLPVGTTIDHPELLVGAHDEHEARRKYLKVLGVILTPHVPAVVEMVPDVPCDSTALIQEAEKGYQPQSV